MSHLSSVSVSDVRVGAGVGEAELLEERRVERLARVPAPALGGVEDEVGRERLEPRRPGARPGRETSIFSTSWPDAAERAGDGVDGLGGVELGLFLGVGELEVVRERDFHRWLE